MISDNNTRVMVTIPKELRDKLVLVADNEGRSLSNLIVQILKNYLQEYEERPRP